MTGIKAVIFDMDGVLIDSEPFWQDSELAVFEEVDIHLTREDCMETTGLRILAVVEHWFARKPWDTSVLSCDAVAEKILDGVVERVKSSGKPLPGVRENLARLAELGVPMGLATSSDDCLIDAVLDKLAIRGYFQVCHSAAHEKFGKPHPAVFISTAEKMGVQPANCLVIEDSLNGLIAARAAQMMCMAIPEAKYLEDPRFAIAHYRFSALTALPEAFWENLLSSRAGNP